MPKQRSNVASLEEVCCKNCIYWNTQEDAIDGVCREGKFAVTPSANFVWPITYLDGWCGRGGWFIQESDRIQSYESLIERFNKTPPK
jgi:hypothetical protein